MLRCVRAGSAPLVPIAWLRRRYGSSAMINDSGAVERSIGSAGLAGSRPAQRGAWLRCGAHLPLSWLVGWRGAGACSSADAAAHCRPARRRSRPARSPAAPRGGACRDGDHRSRARRPRSTPWSPAAPCAAGSAPTVPQGHPCLPCRGRAAHPGRRGRDRAARARPDFARSAGRPRVPRRVRGDRGGVRVGITTIKVAPPLAERWRRTSRRGRAAAAGCQARRAEPAPPASGRSPRRKLRRKPEASRSSRR